MTNEVAMSIIDECRARLAEVGIEDVLIAVGAGNGTAFSFRGLVSRLHTFLWPLGWKLC